MEQNNKCKQLWKKNIKYDKNSEKNEEKPCCSTCLQPIFGWYRVFSEVFQVPVLSLVGWLLQRAKEGNKVRTN